MLELYEITYQIMHLQLSMQCKCISGMDPSREVKHEESQQTTSFHLFQLVLSALFCFLSNQIFQHLILQTGVMFRITEVFKSLSILLRDDYETNYNSAKMTL